MMRMRNIPAGGNFKIEGKMDTIKFLIQGSADEPYQVTFTKEGDNLNAFCSCPAGKNGQYCKHRFNLLGGSTKSIESGNEGDVETILKWLVGSDVEAAMDVVHEATRLALDAKKNLQQAKKKVAKAMRT